MLRHPSAVLTPLFLSCCSGLVGCGSDKAGTVGAESGRGTGGSIAVGSPGSCSAPEVRITEIDVGASVVNNETDPGLVPIALSPIPSGGTRVAWMGSDSQVHVTTLNSDDTVNSTAPAAALAAHDFQDVYADDHGGVVMLTRDAEGGGNLNCGTLTNLCGSTLPSNDACYDMYMVRFDGGTETWATKLTSSSASLPPYSTGPTGPNVHFIWWYMHEGRVVSDGTNYAGYFGCAISVSQNCTNGGGTNGAGINIHQGDRMKVVGPDGALLTGHDSFDWGCSHSGYERILWDPGASKFVAVCKNDAPTGGKSGRLAFAPRTTTILPVDLVYSNVGNIVLGGAGGYWLTESDLRSGQPAGAAGLADVHLVHFTTGAPDQDLMLASIDGQNDRAPHLVTYGSRMLGAWESSTSTGDLTSRSASRTMVVQVLDSTSGGALSPPIQVAVTGNRYHEFKSFPDGSVAFPAAGSSNTKIKILRVMPCSG